MKTTNRYKFYELPNSLRVSASKKANHAGFKPNEVGLLYFKVVNGEITNFSETDLKDQPIKD